MKRDGLGWQPPPLPDDPAERRKIGIRLVILAALGVIAQIISTIAAWWNRATQGTIRNCAWLFTLKWSGQDTSCVQPDGRQSRDASGSRQWSAVCAGTADRHCGRDHPDGAPAWRGPSCGVLGIGGRVARYRPGGGSSVAQWHAGERRPIHPSRVRILAGLFN